MRIKRKFLQLTSKTYPYNTEGQLVHLLPDGYQKDSHGNYFLKVGESTSMFACHLDTSCNKQSHVNHRFDGKFIKTDGKTILGADDKAGMTIILYMIENKIPGLYYFFVGEEVGCIGSTDAAREPEKFKNIKRCISFDRRGTQSVITHQFWGRCCSDAFAIELAARFNKTPHNLQYAPDDTGMITDSAQFIPFISECTNISVGYYKEHTNEEHQDLEHLVKLCKAAVEIDWETLPSERDASIVEEDAYNYFPSYYRKPRKEKTKRSAKLWIFLEEYSNVVECYLTDDRLDDEKAMIWQWIFAQEVYNVDEITGMTWNGEHCDIYHGNEKQYLGGRHALSNFCPGLQDITKDDVELIDDLPVGNYKGWD